MIAYPIWQPKYSTQMVLVDKLKVRSGKNYIFFVADRNKPSLYSFDGDKIRSECKLSSNGKIYCYNIPLSWLNDEGELPKELADLKEKEYSKFKARMNKKK